MRVGESAISRIGTWMSGREPGIYTRRDAGKRRWPPGRTSFDFDMGGSVSAAPRTAGRVTDPSACRGRPCFPYGVVRRIRVEGFGSGKCRRLSPGPRALLNEDGQTVASRLSLSTGIVRRPETA